jgi:hypothetical protein
MLIAFAIVLSAAMLSWAISPVLATALISSVIERVGKLFSKKEEKEEK